MVQKIHPQGVIWIPSSRLMWENQLKKLTAVPSIYKELRSPCLTLSPQLYYQILICTKVPKWPDCVIYKTCFKLFSNWMQFEWKSNCNLKVNLKMAEMKRMFSSLFKRLTYKLVYFFYKGHYWWKSEAFRYHRPQERPRLPDQAGGNDSQRHGPGHVMDGWKDLGGWPRWICCPWAT